MRVKGKKKLNGLTVIVFDTESASIADIIPTMLAAGWSFSHLVVQYKKKDGTTGKKAVQAENAAPIYAKHHFTKWAFTASSQTNASITAVLDGSKNALIIKQSRNGGWKEFAALQFPSKAPYQPQPAPQQQITQIEQKRAAEAQAARDALYGKQVAEEVPDKPQYVKAQERAAERENEERELAVERKKKHIPTLIISIIDVLFVFTIPQGAMGITSWVKAKKLLKRGQLDEARACFKDARALAICGMVFVVIICVIVALLLTKVINLSFIHF